MYEKLHIILQHTIMLHMLHQASTYVRVYIEFDKNMKIGGKNNNNPVT